MQRLIQLLLIFSCAPLLSEAQRIDNTISYGNMSGDQYFRVHYDNDFYAKTDYYYTQGYQFEFCSPILKNNLLTRLLLVQKDSRIKYGLSFEHYGFTPTSIVSDQILGNDRPFAGAMMIKSFTISVNPQKHTRLSSILSTGIVGPAALAGKMQTAIHKWTGDKTPHGWQYQIHNELIINYGIHQEFELVNVPNLMSLNTNINLDAGTLSDKIQAGLTMTIGRFDSPFKTKEKTPQRNFQLYIYVNPTVAFVGYDATLQGGIINTSSPYTISANNLNRTVFQVKSGLVAYVWKIYFEYNRAFISREFKSGRTHKWGGMKIGYAF